MTVRSHLLPALFILTVAMGGCVRHQPRERLAAYLEAHNRNDVEATVAFFTADAEFGMDHQFTLKGRDAIHDIVAWDATLKSNISFSEISGNGQVLTVDRIVERNQWFELAGIQEVTYRPGTRIAFEGGQITAIQAAQLSEESIRAVTEAMDKFMPWAAANHPEKIQRILPDGRFAYNAEAATIWLELLRDWQAEGDESARTDNLSRKVCEST